MPVLEAVAPFLSRRGTVFKGPESLLILKRLNCGLFYGYTQVGKFLTVYPRDDDDACALAQELDRLTRKFGGPAVPFESPVSQGSSVYTRFGAFRATPESGAADVVRGPDGATIPDRRDSNPDWAQHPNGLIRTHSPRTRGPLATSYRAYQAVSQRGKGGVYRALDLTVQPARLCALKEGRTFGEVDIDGSDGRSRLAQELQVLRDLDDHPVQAPRVYAHFVEGGHLYTVLEWIEGESLAEVVQPSNGQRPIDDAMRLARQCALLLSRLHRRGWSWRDMKPANLILSAGRLRPVDFEGTTRLGSVVTAPWGSAGYLPPEWKSIGEASTAQDLYALGITVHQIFTNILPSSDEPPHRLDEARGDAPTAVADLITQLTDADPRKRPSALAAGRRLSRIAREPVTARSPSSKRLPGRQKSRADATY